MKAKEHIKTNYFLDTSIFESQNFLRGFKIIGFAKYAKLGVIDLYMTSISYDELISRFEKRLFDSKVSLKKLEKTIETKDVRIIKNLDIYQKLSFPNIDINKSVDELKRKLDSFIQTYGIKIIEIDELPTKEIFYNYFKGIPPFTYGKKKDEFPDAFILKTLDVWCNREKQKITIISNDKDFLGYKSKNLTITNDLELELEKLTSIYNKEFKLDKIEKITQLIEASKDDIIIYLEPIVRQQLEIISELYLIQNLKIKGLSFLGYKILTLKEEIAEVEAIMEVSFNVNIIPDLNNYEDYLYKRSVISNSTLDLAFNFPIELEIEHSEKYLRKDMLKVRRINEGNDLRFEIN